MADLYESMPRNARTFDETEFSKAYNEWIRRMQQSRAMNDPSESPSMDPRKGSVETLLAARADKGMADSGLKQTGDRFRDEIARDVSLDNPSTSPQLDPRILALLTPEQRAALEAASR